jgi:hypothetical protein
VLAWSSASSTGTYASSAGWGRPPEAAGGGGDGVRRGETGGRRSGQGPPDVADSAAPPPRQPRPAGRQCVRPRSLPWLAGSSIPLRAGASHAPRNRYSPPSRRPHVDPPRRGWPGSGRSAGSSDRRPYRPPEAGRDAAPCSPRGTAPRSVARPLACSTASERATVVIDEPARSTVLPAKNQAKRPVVNDFKGVGVTVVLRVSATPPSIGHPPAATPGTSPPGAVHGADPALHAPVA